MDVSGATMETTTRATAPNASPRRLRLWLAIAAGIPLAMFLLAVALIRWPSYQRYSDSHWIFSERDLFAATNRPCDIVIFGDSTAMVGLDPRIISARTGLTTCNIASPIDPLYLLGTQPLDLYLRRNPRPRYLLLHFSGRNIRPLPDTSEHISRIDGYLPLLRYGYAGIGIRKMISEPDTIIGLLYYAYIVGPHNIRLHIEHLEPVNQEPTNEDQHLGSYTVIPKPPELRCLPAHEEPIDANGVSWARSTRAHFSPLAGTVIFDIAPTSVCNPLAQQWKQALTGVTDNDLEIAPQNFFVDELNHPTRETAIRHSNEIADQILALENQSRAAQNASQRITN